MTKTDEYYTPDSVYEVVLSWVKKTVPSVNHLEVCRPFYKGGDYLSEDYSKKVVIDNPPFSILSDIRSFYLENGIPYFLFAPHQQCFGQRLRRPITDTSIITESAILYEPNFRLTTSFVSNMFGDRAVLTAPDLSDALDELRREELRRGGGGCLYKGVKTQYNYPASVVTASRLGKLAKIPFELRHTEVCFVHHLKQPRPGGTTENLKLFGGGFLISKKAQGRLEKAFEDLKILRKERGEEVDILLSEREEHIISKLD